MQILAIATIVALLVACSSPESGSTSPRIPATPVGDQLRWLIGQLNGTSAPTERDISAHFAPEFLQGFPSEVLAQTLQQTSAQSGGVTLRGFSTPLDRAQAIALLETEQSVEGTREVAAYINVEPEEPHRITYLALSEPPYPSARDLATPGPYTGAFGAGEGREIFLTCSGSGSPTVILESGAGGGANAWVKVQPDVASFTRVCSYDRANIPGGASDPAPKPRTGKDVVADLHGALSAAGVPGPYVLVGHSDGGLFVRLYASTFPEDVAGMVLVDAVSEFEATVGPRMLKELLPPQEWKQYQAQLQQPAPPFVARVDDEQIDLERTFAETEAAASAHPLPPIPLFVLTRGTPTPPPPGASPVMAEAQEQLWMHVQGLLADLVPGAKHLVVEDSGHIIQEDEPQVVIDAIQEVVEGVRSPGSWSSDQ